MYLITIAFIEKGESAYQKVTYEYFDESRAREEYVKDVEAWNKQKEEGKVTDFVVKLFKAELLHFQDSDGNGR